jgi:hypothetical protein
MTAAVYRPAGVLTSIAGRPDLLADGRRGGAPYGRRVHRGQAT